MRTHLGAFFPKTPRSIRLGKDLEDIKALKRDSTILDFEASGDPPDRYLITFHGDSLVPGKEGGVKIGKKQQVEIYMGAGYPAQQPDIHWKTPILHPNISHGSICLGNFGREWTPYSKLPLLLEVLWDYSRLAILNPYGGYGESGKTWEDLRREYQFPVDRRPLRDKVLANDEGSSIVRPSGDEFDIVIMPDDEGQCEP